VSTGKCALLHGRVMFSCQMRPQSSVSLWHGTPCLKPAMMWENVTETMDKAAVLHITRQLSFELAPDVRVNALAPGLVKTKFAAALWEGPGEDRIAAPVPLRRLGVPDDIATAALFLAS